MIISTPQSLHFLKILGTCFYQDASKGVFKWSRKSGRTSSFLTGPSTDHTKGNSYGYYVYVEASVGNNYDLATFNSPTIKQAASTCSMTFWYHMYGTSIGELTVYVQQGYRLTNLWSIYGDQGLDFLPLKDLEYLIRLCYQRYPLLRRSSLS